MKLQDFKSTTQRARCSWIAVYSLQYICRDWEFAISHSQHLKFPLFCYQHLGHGTYKASKRTTHFCLGFWGSANLGDRTQSWASQNPPLCHINQLRDIQCCSQHGLWPQSSATWVIAPGETKLHPFLWADHLNGKKWAVCDGLEHKSDKEVSCLHREAFRTELWKTFQHISQELKEEGQPNAGFLSLAAEYFSKSNPFKLFLQGHMYLPSRQSWSSLLLHSQSSSESCYSLCRHCIPFLPLVLC